MDLKCHKITFLWAEKTGYLDNLLNALSQKTQSVCLIHWGRRSQNANLYNDRLDQKYRADLRCNHTVETMVAFLHDFRPTIIVVSGWMDSGYLRAITTYKRSFPKVRIVAGIDDQWWGTLRQKLGVIYFNIFYRKIFDFMWICGMDQYAYARFFHYPRTQIIKYLYCGNFSHANIVIKHEHRFVYVGRLMRSKGVDILVKAHKSLPLEERSKFPLVIIGDGELNGWLKENLDPHIKHIRWLQPDALLQNLSLGGVGICPSRKEQWGVIVHEYSQCSMPLILSDVVGASKEFLVNGLNGWSFKNNDMKQLTSAMQKFIDLSDLERKKMGKVSKRLSETVKLEFSVAELLSLGDIQ